MGYIHLNRRYALEIQGWMERVALKVVSLFGIPLEEIYRKGRPKDRMEALSVNCFWCSRELGLALADIARILGMTSTGVGYAVRRGEDIAEKRAIRLLGKGDKCLKMSHLTSLIQSEWKKSKC